MLRSWVAEIFCDCLAVHHLGPTYLYSFLVEVAAGSLDEVASTHPPPRLRVQLLLQQLDRLGWANVMRAGDATLDAWIRDLVASRASYTGVEGFLVWAGADLRAVVRKEVEKLLRGRAFTPDPQELAEVRLLLEAGIPPAQVSSGAAIGRESIMLECWHVALSNAGHGPLALAEAPDAPELAAILPAALELSALTQVWEAT